VLVQKRRFVPPPGTSSHELIPDARFPQTKWSRRENWGLSQRWRHWRAVTNRGNAGALKHTGDFWAGLVTRLATLDRCLKLF
jgi:hypothetical protein